MQTLLPGQGVLGQDIFRNKYLSWSKTVWYKERPEWTSTPGDEHSQMSTPGMDIKILMNSPNPLMSTPGRGQTEKDYFSVLCLFNKRFREVTQSL